MFQGFYNLTSGMLTQNRNLNVISNNMANVSTPGFRSDKYNASTFREELFSRTGNKNKSNPSALGNMAMMRGSVDTVTNYKAAGIEPTKSSLDFALTSKGFFCIQTGNGTVYTRNGSFTLDDQGYLYLPTIGRVLGENGPIRLGTDKIRVDASGTIYSQDGNTRYGQLQIVDFQNYETQLNKTTGDVFTATGQAIPVNAQVVGSALESSNVDAIDQMAQMMSSQRALQSSAQVLKMYDQLMGKIVSQLGPV